MRIMNRAHVTLESVWGGVTKQEELIKGTYGGRFEGLN
jgi:hypothetical protein